MEAVMLKARQAMQEVARSSPDLIRAALERSKDIAAEATKRAEHIKELALEGAGKVNDEEELGRYGITPELRDFVQGLTIDTFRDFPLNDNEMCKVEQVGEIEVPENSSWDLSQWQEQHARLVLSAVPEISDFRYKLCPKFIKESRFWRIYFTLAAGHIASCQASPVKPAAPRELAGDGIATHPQPKSPDDRQDDQKLITAGSQRNRLDDQDLDDYLMGGSSDEEEEEFNDEGFDKEFEQFVKDAALQSDDDEG